jgi:DNA-binding IclR family transcriptional regulator
MRSNAAPGTSVLQRAALILDAFSEAEPQLDLGRLAAITGLPRSTVHRLAMELVGLGQLDRPRVGSFCIGTALWERGELAPVSIRLREAALPHLLALFAATGENVHLAVRAGTDALYVARLTGHASVPTLSRMGGRLPLHTTGVVKALLSAMDQAWLAEYFTRPRERETIHSVVDEQTLRREIASAREAGYAVTRQEMTLGNVSVAAPLRLPEGFPPAAVGVVTHLARGEAPGLPRLVMRAAAEISRDLSR